MKSTDDKLDLLISKLQVQTPKADNPMELTDDILKQIGQRPVKRPPVLLFTIRMISTIAASLLLLFFLKEQSIEAAYPQNKHLYVVIVKSQPQLSQQSRVKGYLNHIRNNSMKNERLKSLLNQ
ncbi:MAG: hypothetical protein Q8909_12385 [Bacteroidota bacterium]|nr:hypothetical protein [Bacteroidota bacterium]